MKDASLYKSHVDLFGPTDEALNGERFGMIRFGSRTDIYLPKDKVEVLISQGDKVLAGRTPVARFIEA